MIRFFDIRNLAPVLLFLAVSIPLCLRADDLNAPDYPALLTFWSGLPSSVHVQATVIPQYHPPFDAQYSGLNSLGDGTQLNTSVTSTIFLGLQIAPSLEFYLDPELTGGSGFSGTTGLADFPNGEICRVSGGDQPQFNIARVYVQWELGLGGPTEIVANDLNQVAGTRDISRLTLLAGKFALSDFFDDNAYSHDARNQFMNWGLMDNGAWDYAADTHGYTNGLYADLNQTVWAIRFAEAQEPTVANGDTLDDDLLQAHSENLEVEAHWAAEGRPGKLRWLGFWNHADMGNYRTTLDTPSDEMSITNSRVQGSLKYGFGLDFEQEITKSLGSFFRAGWNNGQTESWAFTEVDQCASGGFQLSGDPWNRPQDHFGVAYVISGLSAPHLEYLAAGGYGFNIGDGALDYAPEQALETYYSLTLITGLSISPDYQFFRNPAYNQARGPVQVVSLRVHYQI